MTADIEKPLTRAQWWGCFILASIAMSWWFKACRLLLAAPTALHILQWVAMMLILTLLLALLVYDGYVKESGRGRVQKKMRLFEWLIQKRFLLRGDA